MSYTSLKKLEQMEDLFKELKQPLNYFKKLNILPIEIVEEKIEKKYITKQDLYMSNMRRFNNRSIIPTMSCYGLETPNCSPNYIEVMHNLVYRFSNIYNIDQNLLQKEKVVEDIISNLDKYRDNGVLNKYWYNTLYNQILNYFNKNYELYSKEAYLYLYLQKYKIKVEDLQAGMCIGFKASWRDDIWIKKICAKTIKYNLCEFGFYNNLNNKIIKKVDLEELLENYEYKVYSIDRNTHNSFNGTYLYDEDNNLILE